MMALALHIARRSLRRPMAAALKRADFTAYALLREQDAELVVLIARTKGNAS